MFGEEKITFPKLTHLWWAKLDHQRGRWHPTPILLPWESRGQRSLVGWSPRGREELDIIERLRFHFSLSRIGEGNGNLLQCSCLENPRDRGSWWAAVYGVAQGWTQLKELSSSSSKLDHKEVWALKKWSSNCCAGEDSWESLGQQGDQSSQS